MNRILYISFILLFSILNTCSKSEYEIKSSDLLSNIDLLNQNPYLTDKYLEKRRKNENYIYFIVDTLHIKNAVKLSYKKEWLQIDMITSEEELHELDIDILTPWELLSRDHFYLQGIGGPRHPFFSEYIIREHPHHDFDNRSSFDQFQYYAFIPLAQEKFLFVIIDEATYMLLEAVEGINAPITAHTIGLPFKMLYPLEED